MALRIRIVALCLVGGIAVGGASGQDQGKTQGKGNGRNRQRGGRTMGRGSGDLVALLASPEVRTALKVTDDEAAFLKLLGEENQEKSRKFFESLNGLSREDRTEKIRDWSSKRAPEVDKQLTEIIGADRLKRLKQIRLQIAGTRSFSSPDVQKELGITSDQRTKIDAVRNSGREEFTSLFRSNDDPDARQKAMEEFRKQQSEKVLAVLTDQQRQKWKEMQGEPIDFKLAPPQFAGGRGNGQRRQRGGNRPPAEKKDAGGDAKKKDGGNPADGTSI